MHSYISFAVIVEKKKNPLIFSCSYLQEGEVAVSIDAGNLQIAHDNFTVLVELPQGAVLLIQVRETAQLVICASTN